MAVQEEDVFKVVLGLKPFHTIKNLQLDELRRALDPPPPLKDWKPLLASVRNRFAAHPELGVRVGGTVVRYDK